MLRPLALIASLVLTAPAALAAPPHSVAIPVTEADMLDADRLETLHDRITEAAVEVCRDRLRGDLLRPMTLPVCVERTREAALEQVEQRLAELARERPQLAEREH